MASIIIPPLSYSTLFFKSVLIHIFPLVNTPFGNTSADKTENGHSGNIINIQLRVHVYIYSYNTIFVYDIDGTK